MEAEVALKVLVYLISCRSNQILSMRLPFFNISLNTGWLSIAADPRLAYQTVEAFNDDTEAADKNFETSAHLLDRVVKERKSRLTVSQDGDVEL